MTDYYSRAIRQGASAYMASEYERYALAAIAEYVKPLPCNHYLQRIDTRPSAIVIREAHSIYAGRTGGHTLLGQQLPDHCIARIIAKAVR